MAELWVLLPELILVFMALLLVLLGFVANRRPAVLWGLAMGTLLVAGFLTLDLMVASLRTQGSILQLLSLNLWGVPSGSPLGPQSFPDLLLQKDLFSMFFHIVFLFVAFLAVLASRSYIKREEPHQAEYYSLIFLSVFGMMVVAMTTDLFVLFLAFELSSLSTFALVAFRKRDKKATEASAKFFVIGAVSSAIILFGISLIYGVTGSTAVPGYATAATTSFIPTATSPSMNQALGIAVTAGFEPTIIVAIVFLIAGFGFKVATVPFHQWAPDVYEGAPDTITVFLAAGTKKVGVVAFFKIFLIGMVSVTGDWLLALAVLAVVTQTVGNILAIPQRSVKRMLAYSSIAQAGYILIAIVVATIAWDPAAGRYGGAPLVVASYALGGGLYHVLTHAIMKGGAFLAVSAASAHVGDRVEDFKGLAKRMPFVSLALAVFLLSLAGIPPFGGFFSKFVLFSSAIYAAPYNGWMVWLAVAGVLNSALSLYYYARVIRYMYIEEGDTTPLKVPGALNAAIAVAFFAIIVTGVVAWPFITAAQAAGVAFFPVR